MKEAVMPCILIIEDDTTFSLILSTWLKKKNFTVKAVTSVSDAKQEIETGNYNLLLSDFRLPDGDGINILKWLKETRRSMPLIMMTGYADIQTAVQSMKSGASDYITKPINQNELLLKMNELLTIAKTQSTPVSFPQRYIEGQSAVACQMYEYIRILLI